MPQKLSNYLKIEDEILEKRGVFNRFLDVDANYFINITRIKSSQVPEFKAAYQKINDFFGEICKILQISKHNQDKFYKEAIKRFSFHEVNGLGLGYSKGIYGSGFGKILVNQIIKDAKEIIDAGTNDPELFHLVGLFEENIGADRLSDMFAGILEEEIRSYTLRIYNELNINLQKYNNLPFNKGFLINPNNGHDILLVPTDILHEIPIATNWEEIDTVCQYNELIRSEINDSISKKWKDITISEKKNIFKDILLNKKIIAKNIIEEYRKCALEPYDFKVDPKGEYLALSYASMIVEENPLVIDNITCNTFEIAKSICEQFKQLIENNKLYDVLYYEKKCRGEKIAQLLFFSIAESYCKANNIDMSAEVNNGRGPVDFKFSKGHFEKTLIEIKLTTNQQLCHGIETQLIEYGKAEKTKNLIYLVLDTGGPEARIQKMYTIFNNFSKELLENMEVIYIDARPKQSASTY